MHADEYYATFTLHVFHTLNLHSWLLVVNDSIFLSRVSQNRLCLAQSLAASSTTAVIGQMERMCAGMWRNSCCLISCEIYTGGISGPYDLKMVIEMLPVISFHFEMRCIITQPSVISCRHSFSYVWIVFSPSSGSRIFLPTVVCSWFTSWPRFLVIKCSPIPTEISSFHRQYNVLK